MNVSIDSKFIQKNAFELKWHIITDGHPGAQTFPLLATIRRPATVSPTYFELGTVDPNESEVLLESKIEFEQGEIEKITVQPVLLEPGMKWLGTERRGQAIYAKMKLNASEAERRKSGVFQVRGTLAIREADGSQLVQAIGVGGRLLPWIEVWPEIVSVGAMRPGETVTRSVRFSSHASGTPELHTFQPEYVKARVKNDTVEIDFTAPKSPMVFRSAVLLTIGQEPAMIPIEGVLLGGTPAEEVRACAACGLGEGN
jgi:hypothetical protein